MARSNPCSRPRGRAATCGAALLRTAVALLLAGPLLGCSSYAYYSRTTLQEYGLTPESVKAIQFYIDTPFTLEFEKHTTESTVSRYGVDNRKERYRKRIEVVERAGGEAVAVGEDWIKVQVAHDMTLEFRLNPKSSYQMFYLQAINDQPVEHGGTIHYRDRYYKVLFGVVGADNKIERRARPRLLYEVISVEERRSDREEIEGIWLKDRDERAR